MSRDKQIQENIVRLKHTVADSRRIKKELTRQVKAFRAALKKIEAAARKTLHPGH
jgi:hypothetical protein